MASVEIHGVRKAYGATQFIHGVSVDIQDGEFVILVGPSGCGMSTLLRMVAGLEKITGGEIRIGSRVVNNVPPNQRLATTTVYVTYDQIEAMTMADKIVVMHDGIVEQIGAPLDLYDRPANLFVAGFIGSPAMNVLEGKIGPSGFMAGGMTLPVQNAPAASDGRSAYYGIRPEHFRLTGDGMPVEVIVTEPTGSETLVLAKAGGRELTNVFRERVSARPGETIHIPPKPALVDFFDKETGQRL